MMPAVAAEREPMVGVVDDLIVAVDDEYGVGLVTMLRGEDFQDSLAQNGSSGNDPLHKPVLGRVMLAATRAYFRAVDRISAVRRHFVNSLYTYRSR